MAFILYCLLVALNFAALSLQDTKDPLIDFCRRFGHQTAVIDRRLYIDGGLVNWNPISQNRLNYTNTWLLYNDLNTTTSSGGMPQLHANLTKNSTIPSVSGGILWADDVNKVFYLYGGEFQNTPQDFTFWQYDTILDRWNLTDDNTLAGITRVSYGAGTSISELGFGFYFGGWVNSQNVPEWSGAPLATSNLIKYDMNANAWTNNTGPDSTGRAEGVMVYLPASDGGLLVYFGGIMDPYRNGTIVGSNMSSIYIFDVASSKWYTQPASGDIPEMRRKFCAGATWAKDQSSYNIYLYGGQGINNITGFDDVYILSLPSFTWIKWFPSGTTEGTNPHGISSCNVIENSQMLVIGGYFAQNDDCDSPNVWGTHNMNLGENGPKNAIWDYYYPNITKYFVPPEVVSKIGGGPTGGATATQPASGFSNPDLSVYFTRIPTFAVRTATRSFPTATSTPSGNSTTTHKSTSHTGAIAGGVVGGLAGIILILLAILYLLRRHKKSLKNKPKVCAPPPPPTELPANDIHSPIPEMDTPINPSWKMTPSPGTQTATPAYTQSHSPAQAGSPIASVHGRSPSGNPISPAYHTPGSPYGPQYSQGTYLSTNSSSTQSATGTYVPSTYAPPSTYPPGTYPQDAYPTGTYQSSEGYPTGIYPEQQYAQQQQQQQQQQQHTLSPSASQYQPPPNPPYDPSQHALHQQHFPPPPGADDVAASSPGGFPTASYPNTTSNTPAHFYPQPLNVARRSEGSPSGVERRPIRGRFVEEED